jgi:NTP pyrophosphatase (non-canonical NTP hydrolase)
MEKVLEPMPQLEITELQKLVVQWAKDKKLIKKENAPKQFMKVVEELGELSSAIIKEDIDKELDGFADVLITIIILAEQRNIDLKLALNLGWNEIKNRTGKTIGGSFIKD